LAHAAPQKVSLGLVGARFGYRHAIQPVLLGLAVVERDLRHRGRDGQQVHSQLPGHQTGGAIFGDHGPRAGQLAWRLLDHPDAPAADGDDYELPLKQYLYCRQLNDAQGCGRSDYAPPAAPRILDHSPACFLKVACAFHGGKAADALAGVLEGRVVILAWPGPGPSLQPPSRPQ
jgi:hypothetical protein